MLKNGFCLQKWYYSLSSRTSIVPHLPMSLSANNNNKKNSEGSTFHCRFVLVLSSCEWKKKKQKNLILGSQVRGIGPNIRRFLKLATVNWCSSLCGNNNFLYHYFCLSSGRYKFHSTSYENKIQTKILLKIEKFEKIDHG